MTTTWFAIIAENDFPEFVHRVRGLGSSYAAYMAKLDRREAEWLAGCPDSEAIRVRLSLADLERYCRHRGGSCAARELGRLANLKHAGQLWMNGEPPRAYPFTDPAVSPAT